MRLNDFAKDAHLSRDNFAAAHFWNASKLPNPKARGFSLIELLVVMIGLAILITLLLPAVQQCREAVRRQSCQRRLLEMAVALHCHESTHGYLPSAWYPIPGSTDGWSAHLQLLPFLGEVPFYSRIDLSKSWSIQTLPDPTGKPQAIDTIPLSHFHCPTYVGGLATIPGTETCFVVNRGTWEVWDPLHPERGDGPFRAGPKGLEFSAVRDGLNQTIGIAETLPLLGFMQNSASIGNLPFPKSPASLTGNRIRSGAHSHWINGQAIETGFTGALPIGSLQHWINLREGSSSTSASYAAINLMSNHPGGFNVCYLSGSASFLSQSMAENVFRAMVTPCGEEFSELEK